jgi:hypothetical protein
MSRRTPEGEQLTEAICISGLKQTPSQLTTSELEEQRQLAETLILKQDGVPIQHLIEAIRFGMPKVWPFSQQQYFDARDVLNNITKAKAAAATLRRRSQLPIAAAEARRRDRHIRGET